jgi:GNAT superfamily N-acetyltransferase
MLREVAGGPEELAVLQRVMESDEYYFLRVTGHAPGPADAQSTLMFVPDGKSPEDKAPLGVWADDELVGILDLLLRYLDDETLYIGLLLIDRGRQGQGIGTAAYQTLERELLPAGRGSGGSASAWSAPTTRSSASGAGWASPRPARSAPGATTSSSPRRS